MDMTPYVRRLGQEFAALADTAGDDARDLFQRFSASLEPAIRLTLLEALSAAAEEITREMAPSGSVELRLRGLDPDFVVTQPEPSGPPSGYAPYDDTPGGTASDADADTDAADDDATPLDGPVARINFRPPEQLKAAIEAEAAHEGRSVNAWLIRVSSAALRRRDREQPPPKTGRASGASRYRGWVR